MTRIIVFFITLFLFVNPVKSQQVRIAYVGEAIHNIPLYFKDGLTKKINIDSVCKRVENILPAFYFKNVCHRGATTPPPF